MSPQFYFVYQCCSKKEAICNFRLISFLFCSDTVNATKLKQDKNSNRTKITQHTIYSLQIKENVSKSTYPTLPHYLTMLHIILHIMNSILTDRTDKNIKTLYPFIAWSMKIKQWDNKNYSTAITNVDIVTHMISKWLQNSFPIFYLNK